MRPAPLLGLQYSSTTDTVSDLVITLQTLRGTRFGLADTVPNLVTAFKLQEVRDFVQTSQEVTYSKIAHIEVRLTLKFF